jgi:hypothetical protein
MKKTFKIGEYAVGGIIEVKISENNASLRNDIVIHFLDYYDKSIVMSMGRNNKDTNARRELVRFLEEGSTPFYADKVMKWIESKIKFANESNWFI